MWAWRFDNFSVLNGKLHFIVAMVLSSQLLSRTNIIQRFVDSSRKIRLGKIENACGRYSSIANLCLGAWVGLILLIHASCFVAPVWKSVVIAKPNRFISYWPKHWMSRGWNITVNRTRQTATSGKLWNHFVTDQQLNENNFIFIIYCIHLDRRLMARSTHTQDTNWHNNLCRLIQLNIALIAK